MTEHWFLKPPLLVKWMTDLPPMHALRRSSSVYFGCSEWTLELRYCSKEVYELTLHTKNSLTKSLEKDYSLTTYIEESVKHERIYIEKLFSLGNILWRKSRKEILQEIPSISATNKFTIICLFHTMETYLKKRTVSTQTIWTGPVNIQSLSHKLSTFLKNEFFSDVKLKCSGRNFDAHRLVLAARSEVFAAMFRNKMAEAETGVVDIQDVDPDILDLLLQYMYLGERPDLCKETARRLYEAADKYAVLDLRRACSGWLVKYQTPENCLDLLEFADKHSDENFKEEVLRFVAEHMAELSIDSWSTMKEMHPHLVIAVLEKRLFYLEFRPNLYKRNG